MLESVYIIEHPDHVCTVHYFKPEEAKQKMKDYLQYGILWFEDLGVMDRHPSRKHAELSVVSTKSSRPMLFFDDPSNDSSFFMAVDHAKKMFAIDSSDYDWSGRVNSVSQIFVRFGTHSYPALIFRPYCMGDWRLLNKITVPFFIQETMIQPICTLSVDLYDEAYSECYWRESLGEVEAEVIKPGCVDVPLSIVNDRVRKCSRKMLLVSDQTAPKYIPSDWLGSAVLDANLRISLIENREANNLVH
jgi:hypothetical protein